MMREMVAKYQEEYKRFTEIELLSKEAVGGIENTLMTWYCIRCQSAPKVAKGQIGGLMVGKSLWCLQRLEVPNIG